MPRTPIVKEVKVIVILELPDHAPVQPWPQEMKINPDYSAAIWSLLRDMQSQENRPAGPNGWVSLPEARWHPSPTSKDVGQE
jgi:hypothetical protein